MRDRLVETLGGVPYRRFLVYLMGPYKAFDVADVMSADVDAPGGPFDQWDEGAGGEYEQADVKALLETTRDRLRDEVGLNAFLATDANVSLDEKDAASQSIGFARANNVVALVAPQVGRNLGVGIETGSVLEALDETKQERVVLVKESGVTSAMIDALSRRWDATILTYKTDADLFDHLRTFSVQVMNAEYTGELPDLDAEE